MKKLISMLTILSAVVLVAYGASSEIIVCTISVVAGEEITQTYYIEDGYTFRFAREIRVYAGDLSEEDIEFRKDVYGADVYLDGDYLVTSFVEYFEEKASVDELIEMLEASDFDCDFED